MTLTLDGAILAVLMGEPKMLTMKELRVRVGILMESPEELTTIKYHTRKLYLSHDIIIRDVGDTQYYGASTKYATYERNRVGTAAVICL